MSFMTKIRAEEKVQTLPDRTAYVETLIRAERPILIVEGDRDQEILGWIANVTREDSRYHKSLSVESQEVGGRPNLLAIYDELKERAEFDKAPVIFVADRDMWIFEGIPVKYANDIIFTSGYCIENDLYAGTNLTALLEDHEAEIHDKMLASIIEWFTFGVEKRLKKEKPLPQISVDLKTLIPDGSVEIASKFCPTCKPCSELQTCIEEAYKLKLPGKLLFELILRFTGKPGRKPTHTKTFLFNSAFKVPVEHKYRDELIGKLKVKLEEAEEKIRIKRMSSS